MERRRLGRAGSGSYLIRVEIMNRRPPATNNHLEKLKLSAAGELVFVRN